MSFNRPKPWSKVKTWRSDLHLDSVDFGQTGINRKIRWARRILWGGGGGGGSGGGYG